MKRISLEDDFIIGKIDELCDKKISEDFIEELLFLNRIYYKYYELYAPGLSFFDHLFMWLQNFDKENRINALNLLESVIFFSREEIKVLANQIFREKIKKYLLDRIIKDDNEIKSFDYSKAYKKYSSYLSQSLFISLSDGAMIDYFRRTNKHL